MWGPVCGLAISGFVSLLGPNHLIDSGPQQPWKMKTLLEPCFQPLQMHFKCVTVPCRPTGMVPDLGKIGNGPICTMVG